MSGKGETANSFLRAAQKLFLFQIGSRRGDLVMGEMSKCAFTHVCKNMRGQLAEAARKKKKTAVEEWKRPPLAVPVGWFELETPAGIRACTSCQPGSVGLSVCVSNGSGGKTNKRGGGRRSRLPAAVHPFVGTLVTMKSRCIKKKEENLHAVSYFPATLQRA